MTTAHPEPVTIPDESVDAVAELLAKTFATSRGSATPTQIDRDYARELLTTAAPTFVAAITMQVRDTIAEDIRRWAAQAKEEGLLSEEERKAFNIAHRIAKGTIR